MVCQMVISAVEKGEGIRSSFGQACWCILGYEDQLRSHWEGRVWAEKSIKWEASLWEIEEQPSRRGGNDQYKGHRTCLALLESRERGWWVPEKEPQGNAALEWWMRRILTFTLNGVCFQKRSDMILFSAWKDRFRFCVYKDERGDPSLLYQIQL